MKWPEFLTNAVTSFVGKDTTTLYNTVVQVHDLDGRQWFNVEGIEHVTYDDSDGASPVLIINVRPAP